MFVLLVVIVLAVIFGVLTAFVVPQQSVYIIESFGKFSRAETAGLHFKIPIVEMVEVNLWFHTQYISIGIAPYGYL
jgi:regulator of protease activity HflC (stomatin/prohibitin superfamily)